MSEMQRLLIIGAASMLWIVTSRHHMPKNGANTPFPFLHVMQQGMLMFFTWYFRIWDCTCICVYFVLTRNVLWVCLRFVWKDCGANNFSLWNGSLGNRYYGLVLDHSCHSHMQCRVLLFRYPRRIHRSGLFQRTHDIERGVWHVSRCRRWSLVIVGRTIIVWMLLYLFHSAIPSVFCWARISCANDFIKFSVACCFISYFNFPIWICCGMYC